MLHKPEYFFLKLFITSVIQMIIFNFCFLISTCFSSLTSKNLKLEKMRRFTKWPRIHFSGKGENKQMHCNHSSDRVPSEKECMRCYGNLYAAWGNKLREFPFMSDEDMIAFLINEKHEMDKVRALNNMNFIGLIDTKLTHAIKCLEEKHTNEKNITTILPLDEILPDSNCKKIPVTGLKGEFAINAGWFFFNPDNPFGLHLSKKHTEAVITLLRERFTAFDGSPFSHRYMVDKIAFGRNNEPEEGI